MYRKKEYLNEDFICFHFIPLRSWKYWNIFFSLRCRRRQGWWLSYVFCILTPWSLTYTMLIYVRKYIFNIITTRIYLILFRENGNGNVVFWVQICFVLMSTELLEAFGKYTTQSIVHFHLRTSTFLCSATFDLCLNANIEINGWLVSDAMIKGRPRVRPTIVQYYISP